MRVVVFGTGAIGGVVGAFLARHAQREAGAGAEAPVVTLVARGAALAAMRAEGLRVSVAAQLGSGQPAAELRVVAGGAVRFVDSGSAAELAAAGPQDYVLCTVKGFALAPALAALAPLLGPRTTLVTLHNGLPFWYWHGAEGPAGAPLGQPLLEVDPGGALWEAVGPERCLGGNTYIGATVVRPGVVACSLVAKVPIGEPGGGSSARAERLCALLTAAGIPSAVAPDIRAELWMKLMGNLALNPASALTGQTLGELTSHPGSRAVVEAVMQEVGGAMTVLGLPQTMSPAERLAGTVGKAHKTSMLQDAEAGRRLEVEHILDGPLAVAAAAGCTMPAARLLAGLLRARASKL
jgi:2-dehydropantoate 2-reductase